MTIADPAPRALRALPVAADLTGIDPAEIIGLVGQGRIGGFRIGTALHVDLAELAEVIGRSPSMEAPPPPGSPDWIHVTITPAMAAATETAAAKRGLPAGEWAATVVATALEQASRAPVGAHRWTTRGAAQIYTATLGIPVHWDPRHLAEAAYHQRTSQAEWIRRQLLDVMTKEVAEDVAERARLARSAPAVKRKRQFVAQLTTPMAPDAHAQVVDAARLRGQSLSAFAREVWITAAALPDHGVARISGIDDASIRGATGLIGLVEPDRRSDLLRTIRQDAGMVWAVWARAQLVEAARVTS